MPEYWYANSKGGGFKNDSGEAVPPFAAMGIASSELEEGAWIPAIRKPTSADIAAGAAGIIFNDDTEVPIDGTGFFHLDSVVHAVKDGTVGHLAECGPVEDEWTLSAAGSGYLKIGDDEDSITDGIIVRSVGGGGSQLFKTPGGGIAAATGTGPYTWGSAACTPVGSDGVVGSGAVTIKNIVNQAIAANVIIKATKVGSIWVVDVASCS